MQVVSDLQHTMNPRFKAENLCFVHKVAAAEITLIQI